MRRRAWLPTKCWWPLFLPIFAGVPIVCQAQAPMAETAQGPVQGRLENGIATFRGIPFAAPPVGALRWREPQPVQNWTAPRQADTAGPSCIQQRGTSLENGGDPGKLDEDCLYLNVFTPLAKPAAALPVMVWIHGGGLVIGGGALLMYDGSALARRDVILVTINYRLGVLGFFSHPALDQESPGGPVNFGLLDQIAALRWVHNNIHAFGGDPARVTIAGQSAGAQSVLALMASPVTAGMFSAAIAESAYGIPNHPRAKASETGLAIAAALGYPNQTSATALRGVGAERFADLAPDLSLAPTFIIGDKALPLPILETFKKGLQHAVPLVIGNNSDDASVLASFNVDPAALVRKMGGARKLIGALYPGVSDQSQLGREVARDAVFTAFARRIAYLHSPKAPTWRYYFTGTNANGAVHGGEVPYVFGTLDICQCLGRAISPIDRSLERRMIDRWAAFVAIHSPTGETVWPQDSRRVGQVLEMGEHDTVRPRFMAARINAVIVALNYARRKKKRD